MADRALRRCGLEFCTSGLPARPYPAGWLCDHCCPSARAGTPHPDQIAAISRKNWAASIAAASTTQEAA